MQLAAAFPEFGNALHKPLNDLAGQKASFGVLDILLNARAPSQEIRAVACRWSAFSDETGTSKSALEVFDRLSVAEPTWIQAKEAHCRLFIHLNRPVQALRLIDSSKEKLSPGLASLKGLCLLKSDPGEAERLLASSMDYVNLAALKESNGDGDASIEWEKAVSHNPDSMAALNGAKKFDQTMKMQWDESFGGSKADFEARLAQALTGLAMRARDELFAVTSEGLFRSAISHLEQSSAQAKKPVYLLELSKSFEEYAKLLKKWKSREKEADILQAKAKGLRETTSSFLPSFAFDVKGWTIEDNSV
jgi:hypothetical protein